MLDYLVVRNEKDSEGANNRGLVLYDFLRTFVGASRARYVTTDELLASDLISTRWLMIGLPTRFHQEHLKKVRFQNAALFDYTDSPAVFMEFSDREFLLSLTNIYLKQWVDPNWDDRIRWVTAPIRRNQKQVRFLRLRDRLRRTLHSRIEFPRRFDVAFRGGPTNALRIQWLRQIKEHFPDKRFWGGIVCRASQRGAWEHFGDISDVCCRNRKLGSLLHLLHLCQSKIALAPRGYAPWSYRHYEGLLSGAIVVGSDLRDKRLLVPVPNDNLVWVRDDESVIGHIEQAFRLLKDRPRIAENNLDFLDRYLDGGGYSPKRPLVFERFVRQCEEALAVRAA